MPTESSANISLALELTSRIGSVALGRANQFLGSEIVQKHSRHHDDVMPAVDRLFARFHFTPEQLNQIFVSIGPGGFTGVRQAVTTAKLLAFATRARILAVPTTTVVAETITIPNQNDDTSSEQPPTLIVALASKRGTSWCAQYTPQLDTALQSRYWKPTGEAHIADLASIIQTTDRPLIIAADFIEDSIRSELTTDPDISIRSPAPTAEACWHAAQRLSRTENPIRESPNNNTLHNNPNAPFTDPLALVPFYGREPEAVRLWKSRSAKS